MKHKILFVNSFKGGAGKTTLSLMHCISNLFDGNAFDNVIYMDLDILGTATSYLFEDGKLPMDKCFNLTGETVKVELTADNATKDLYVAYLDPGFKNGDFSGEEGYLHHKALNEELLKHGVLRFIKENMSTKIPTLIVLDCAPGFSELEQELLRICYEHSETWDAEIEENYVMTLDGAHIRKSLNCLKSSRVSYVIGPKDRTIHLVLLDLQNYGRWVRKVERRDISEEWQEMNDQITEELKGLKVSVYWCRYSEEIALKNTYLREEKVENQVDCYRMTQANYWQLS